jgi:YaiO family outer membrane protein
MHKNVTKILAVAAFIAFAGGAGSPAARADTNGLLTVTNQQSNFTSPGGNYGPWEIQTLQYQWKTGDDVPSITLFNRDDNDRPIPSSSRAVYVDDYHTWSGNFYTYGQISLANGNIQPYRLAYLEGDVKLTQQQNVVAAVGGGFAQNPDGTSTRYISAGPSLYTGPFVLEARWLPADTNGISTAATEGVLTYNRLGKDQVVVTYLTGSEPSVLVGFPPSFTTYQRLNETDVVWRHWLVPNFGVLIGGTFGDHYNRDTGVNIYNQRALEFGLFYGHMVGQPR